MKYLLIIGTCLGLASCKRDPVIHEIHYVPSYGFSQYEPLGQTMSPPGTYDDKNSETSYKNHRQYPPRGERNYPEKYKRGV